MKIYFCGSIAGGRQHLGTYQKIVAHLQQKSHNVLTEHVVRADVLEYEKDFTPEQVYTRDIQWLKECDCVIAEVSTPSLGVGYEISYALRLNKPVLCLYGEGVFLTRMLTGNTSTHLRLIQYKSVDQLNGLLDQFLETL